MEVPLLNKDGQVSSKLLLDDLLLDKKAERGVLYQVENAYLAGLRRGTAKTKTRGEVSGGGRKPWNQKGTGRARQGSSRAIQWRGGGIAFGPQPRSYKQNISKKLKQLALLTALSRKASLNKIYVVEDFILEKISTKTIYDMLKKYSFKGKTLIVLSRFDKNISKSINNIPFIHSAILSNLNAHEVFVCDQVLFFKTSFEELNKKYVSSKG